MARIRWRPRRPVRGNRLKATFLVEASIGRQSDNKPYPDSPGTTDAPTAAESEPESANAASPSPEEDAQYRRLMTGVLGPWGRKNRSPRKDKRVITRTGRSPDEWFQALRLAQNSPDFQQRLYELQSPRGRKLDWIGMGSVGLAAYLLFLFGVDPKSTYAMFGHVVPQRFSEMTSALCIALVVPGITALIFFALSHLQQHSQNASQARIELTKSYIEAADGPNNHEFANDFKFPWRQAAALIAAFFALSLGTILIGYLFSGGMSSDRVEEARQVTVIDDCDTKPFDDVVTAMEKDSKTAAPQIIVCR